MYILNCKRQSKIADRNKEQQEKMRKIKFCKGTERSSRENNDIKSLQCADL